ncbi:M56 family metallopeptidase [Mucilaginibacter psychrotolerans]|uniref:M56 family metallopeptidase n=1 Tax=Mucilaginibacter psychrotolerans TaxID=1524096 RepID=A0A4Y8SFJ8_9SPHI|nr:M56 family metallopeptidase [Mucilaginibacter psychrotolerans]TFF37234.1 M56 family metallopeptidase [Mucilaginibacter psychrotolerans]
METIPNHLINAICDTLLSSLWLGLILAAAAGLAVLCTRKQSAQLRYNLLVGGLGVFTTAVLFVFVKQLLPHETVSGTASVQTTTLPTTIVSQQHLDTNKYDFIAGLLRAHANSIVLIWLLIVLARALQLLTGLQSLYFLRRRQIAAVGDEWVERVQQLADQMGIKRLVGIAESGMAKVPMVIGHLKPLILIPAGLITALPPAGIEAILVHELAHIHRRDYLVNLLISSLEVIFFFNPAVLWLSALIRAERENCCDDMALAQTGSKTNYIKALVACHEYQADVPAYAMAFGGQKNHLLGRVQRMLSNSNTSLSIAERAVLAVGLLMGVLFTAAFTNPDKVTQLVSKVTHTTVTITNNTETETAKTDTLKKKLPPASKPKNVAPLGVAAPVAPVDTPRMTIYHPEKISDSTDILLGNGDMQTRLVKVDGVLYQLNRRADRLMSMQVNGKTVPAEDYPRYLSIIDNLMQTKLRGITRPVNITTSSPAPISSGLGSLKQQPDYNTSTHAYHDGTVREKLTADLIADGIIKNADDLTSFKLSDTEFIVNGKKIPAETYQKYRKAYVKAPENGKQGSWAWMYNFEEK